MRKKDEYPSALELSAYIINHQGKHKVDLEISSSDIIYIKRIDDRMYSRYLSSQQEAKSKISELIKEANKWLK